AKRGRAERRAARTEDSVRFGNDRTPVNQSASWMRAARSCLTANARTLRSCLPQRRYRAIVSTDKRAARQPSRRVRRSRGPRPRERGEAWHAPEIGTIADRVGDGPYEQRSSDGDEQTGGPRQTGDRGGTREAGAVARGGVQELRPQGKRDRSRGRRDH